MSNPLEGFEVMGGLKPRSCMGEAVLAFIETGNRCMGKKYDTRKEAQSALNSARGFIKYHEIKGVKSVLRDNTVMFMRTD